MSDYQWIKEIWHTYTYIIKKEYHSTFRKNIAICNNMGKS